MWRYCLYLDESYKNILDTFLDILRLVNSVLLKRSSAQGDEASMTFMDLDRDAQLFLNARSPDEAQRSSGPWRVRRWSRFAKERRAELLQKYGTLRKAWSEGPETLWSTMINSTESSMKSYEVIGIAGGLEIVDLKVSCQRQLRAFLHFEMASCTAVAGLHRCLQGSPSFAQGWQGTGLDLQMDCRIRGTICTKGY